MQKILFLIVFSLTSNAAINAQVKPVSVRAQGRADGGRMKLAKDDSVRFRKDRQNYHSDLLKPTPLSTSDTLLLEDSIYVRAFRTAAYANNSKDQTKKTFFLGGGILVIYIAAVAAAFAIGAGAFLNALSK